MAKVLGKGLGALIKTYSSNLTDNHTMVLIKSIIPNKNQPRQHFNPEKMNALSESIKIKGILQPLSIRKLNNNAYELIAGERRLRAAKQAGLKYVPVYILNIKNESEMMELALIENIQRDDLNAMEEAEGYAVLSGKYNFTQSKIAKQVAKSRSEIANKLRLLKLPPKIQESLRKKEIEYGHARALLSFRESSKIFKVFNEIVKNKLNVRQTELLIKSINIVRKNKKISTPHKKTEKKLAKYLTTNVIINITKSKQGKIVINFKGQADLNRIIKKIYE